MCVLELHALVLTLCAALVRRERKGPSVAEEAVVRPVCDHSAGNDGQPAHQPDRQGEYRKRKPLVGYHLVDSVGKRRLVLPRLASRERLRHQLLDELVALVGYDRLRVVVELLLAVAYVLLDVLHVADADPEVPYDLSVAFEYLDCVPADRLLAHLALYRLLDVGDRMLDGTREPVGGFAFPAGFGELYGLLRDLDVAFLLQCGDADDLAVERFRDLREVDRVAVPLDDVHHVDGHHHRDPQLRELRREVEVALDVRAVHDVQDRVWLLLDEEFARHLLLKRIRRQRVDAGKVLDYHVLVAPEPAVLLLDGHARPVADVLVGTSQGVEKGGLAAVRISGKRDFDLHFFRSLCCLCD